MSQWVDKLLSIPPWVALLVIGGLCLGEAALFFGFVLPGESAVIVGGVLASYDKVALWLVLVVVIVTAIAGDSIGYEVGRKLGPRLLSLGPLKHHQEKVASAQDYLRRRGGRAVLLGRFTAFLRAIMPGLAGVSRIPYPRFLAFNALGAVTWGGGCVILGYFAGKSFDRVSHDLGLGSAVLAGLVILAVAVGWHLRRRREA